MEVLCSMWNGTPMQLCSLYLCFMKKHHTFVSERPGHGEFGKKSKRNKVLKSELGGLLQVSSVGTIDLKSGVSVTMNLKEGIYAFYDNYAISGFILTVSSSLFTNRSVIIAGDKSPSLSIEFGSDGATFQSNINRMLNYRLLAYYK